ncbi:hypothetical protein Y032_1124g3639 [Ancylostoma ceylanicum]|uniref:Uncharacterized protein n=1 Tax=Ancylostoma ceylanicum TaxID=53326 RepID=A0A016W5S9_9BILA|nr:hypothetical protein Y032_1124g3639 [Ancylostoma ceylanicum]
MAPKRRLHEEGEPPKKKAPTFTEPEGMKLIAVYCKAHDRYHRRNPTASEPRDVLSPSTSRKLAVAESQDAPSSSRVSQEAPMHCEDGGSTGPRDFVYVYTLPVCSKKEEVKLAKANQEVANADKELVGTNQDLAKAKQEETAVRLKEARALLQLRKVEFSRAKLELELLMAATPGRRASIGLRKSSGLFSWT